MAISTKFIGVDLELIKNRNFDIHMEYCFSNHQIFRVENSDNKLIEFYKIWTLKEARVKLLNLGFYALDMASDESLGAFGEIIKCSDKSFIYSVAIF
ncbi:4'-phosphopantetheinyl transferase superfamily protein [uncultured Campylobacter sp.]|uniref:4'-phosphopantetheinyl transferase superfamily protein n=1 Tax=uncultured Campylobacter sp. TaxID=218934 RepID=UPI00259CCC03|nr:4'-phosphopantetheinyl transferase superfamily protein [uncultured Campylobacter sp.]